MTSPLSAQLKLRNRWSNHTGLGGANLYLNNVWVMLRYDVRHYGKPHGGWYVGLRKLGKALVTGWFGRTGIFNCRIERGASK